MNNFRALRLVAMLLLRVRMFPESGLETPPLLKVSKGLAFR
jgi:hypothetical protein